jgi:hypothetical protein
VNAAAEEYFVKGYADKSGGSSSSSTGGGKPSSKALEGLFGRYRDAKSGQMEGEGIAAFYQDLGVDAAQDTVTLFISQYMGA